MEITWKDRVKELEIVVRNLAAYNPELIVDSSCLFCNYWLGNKCCCRQSDYCGEESLATDTCRQYKRVKDCGSKQTN